MDLRYRILWFDDQPEYVKGVEKYLTSQLAATGLHLDITWVADFAPESLEPIISQLRLASCYDLILVDYDLGKKMKGDVLLKKLRVCAVGEMIFYSSVPVRELRTALLAQNIDGIYCLNRDNRMNSEIFTIVEATIRRYFHPNYIRGLVVGSVSDLDAKFTTAILDLMKLANMPSEGEIRRQILEGKRSHLTAELEELKTHGEIVKFDRLVGKANLHVKMEILLQLLKQNGGRIATASMEVLANFLNEVNEPRIEFAHAKTEEHEGHPVFKARNGGKIWKASDMRALIHLISRHKDAVRRIADISDE